MKSVLRNLKREKNSRNGNPKWSGILDCGSGALLTFSTIADSSISYSLCHSMEGKEINAHCEMKWGKNRLISFEAIKGDK